MKIVSKTIDMIDRLNFTRLNAPPPITGLPNPMASTASYAKEKIPPVRSKRTFTIFHPSVDFL